MLRQRSDGYAPPNLAALTKYFPVPFLGIRQLQAAVCAVDEHALPILTQHRPFPPAQLDGSERHLEAAPQ